MSAECGMSVECGMSTACGMSICWQGHEQPRTQTRQHVLDVLARHHPVPVPIQHLERLAHLAHLRGRQLRHRVHPVRRCRAGLSLVDERHRALLLVLVLGWEARCGGHAAGCCGCRDAGGEVCEGGGGRAEGLELRGRLQGRVGFCWGGGGWGGGVGGKEGLRWYWGGWIDGWMDGWMAGCSMAI